jgi:hypothetical protein
MDVYFHLIKALDREKQGHKPRREQQWQKPVMGYLKINLDDAFDVFSMTGATSARNTLCYRKLNQVT